MELVIDAHYLKTWKKLSGITIEISEHGVTIIMTNLKNKPVYWYPGSANDLMPVLLMSPRAHCFGQHLSKDPNDPNDTGLHLWLTDLHGGDDPKAYFEKPQPYPLLWEKFDTKITHVTVESHPDSEINELFSGDHYYVSIQINRCGALETYRFTFTCGNALSQYREFINQKIYLKWLALIKFNALSGSIGRLPQNMERSIARFTAEHPSIPELIASDGYFRYPELPFERLGSRSPDWGNPNQNIARGGGVRGWGFGTTSTMWVLPNAYDDYASFL